MKRFQIIAPWVLLLCLIAYGGATNWNINSRPTSDWFSSNDSPRNVPLQWMRDIDLLVGSSIGTGLNFYVDSGVANAGDGSDWNNAVESIEEAIALCTASRGDRIHVAQGHAETFITESLDVDKIGITIIGYGTGSLKPTITYNHANAEVAIGADNCAIYNIRFLSSITDVLMGIEVEDGVDYLHIEGCDFDVELAGTDDFVEAINFVNNNTGCTIKNCTFNAGAGGAAHAIFCDADTDRLSIIGCDIRGDYSVACIGGDTAAITDVLIQGNILINGDLVADGGLNAVAAISLLDGSAGLIADNRIGSDVATGLLMRVADDCVFVNNYITDTDGDEFSGTSEDSAASIAAHTDG
jgi:hypothetical protein